MATSAVKLSLLDKFELFSSTLQDELVEREEEIHGIQVAFVAGQHVFFLGAPGTGKSFLNGRALAYISGVRKFKNLMTRFDTPPVMVGPLDIPALENSRYRHLTEGYLPEADVADLDEIWKCGDSMLNSLLGITNEREFKNDAVMMKVPLSTMVCSSNELPEGDRLGAIYDRVLLRYETVTLKETASFIKMLRMVIDKEPKPILTWDEVLAAKAEAAALPINDSVYEAMAELRLSLREAGIEPSPRRFRESFHLLRAEAWLDGADEVDRGHMSILTHVFWDRPDQRETVERIVLELANPMEKRIIDLMTIVEKVSKDIDKALADAAKPGGGGDLYGEGMDIHRKLDQANEEYHDIAAELGSSRRQKDLLNTCRQRLHTVTCQLIGDVLSLPTDDIEI